GNFRSAYSRALDQSQIASEASKYPALLKFALNPISSFSFYCTVRNSIAIVSNLATLQLEQTKLSSVPTRYCRVWHFGQGGSSIGAMSAAPRYRNTVSWTTRRVISMISGGGLGSFATGFLCSTRLTMSKYLPIPTPPPCDQSDISDLSPSLS